MSTFGRIGTSMKMEQDPVEREFRDNVKLCVDP